MSCNNCNRNYRQNYQNVNNRNVQMRNMNMAPKNMPPCGCNTQRNVGADNRRKCEQNRENPCGSMDRKNGCDIGKEHIDKMMPAMAFVPWQKWQDVYDMEEALCHGTIFEELDKPYTGRCK